MSALRFRDVQFAYGKVEVLTGVNVEVSAGEVVALLGRNGAGKTTVSRLAMALIHPDDGEVLVAGVSTRGRRPEDFAAHAAYLFQHPDLQLFARHAIDEVMFGPLQLGTRRAAARARAADALEAVGLGAHAQTHPHDLGPPDRKLLALAAALAQTDGLLVLDEPTQGFDRPTAARVGAVVAAHAARGGAALIVTHDLGFVAEWCDRAIVLESGRVAHAGSVRAVVMGETRADELGLRVPPAAALSLALGLPGAPFRHADVVSAIAPRCRRE